MHVARLSKIDWLSSMGNLSIGAFFLLNVLWRYNIDVNDNKLRSISHLGVSTHQKYKKELVDKGYLTVVQVGKATYRYEIGETDGK